MAADMPNLIDRLGEASLTARGLLADIRTATKDLRATLRDAQDERARLADLIKETVAAEIHAEVATQLEALGEKTRQAMDDATAKVGREFDKLANILMTGDDHGRGESLLDLAAEQARRRAGGG